VSQAAVQASAGGAGVHPVPGARPAPPGDGVELERLLALALSRPREALARARTLLATRPPPAVAAVAHQAVAVVLRDFGGVAEALAEFRAALRAAARAGDPARESDVRAAYGLALVLSGRSREGLRQIAAAAGGTRGLAAGRIHLRQANALMYLGDHVAMLDAAQRAVVLLAGDEPVWQARAVAHRAVAHAGLGFFDRADRDYARAEELFAAAGQRLELASLRENRAVIAFARGDLPAALTLLDEAEQVLDELGVVEPGMSVTRVQVLLAAGLDRDAQRVAEDAVARSEQQRRAAARRGELLLSAALAAAAARDPARAADRSRQALALFRRQRRPLWTARAALVLLESRFAVEGATPAVVRVSARLAATAPPADVGLTARARLLAGRAALAAGHRRRAERLLLSAANPGRPDLRARTTGWLARAVLAESAGRSRDLLAACARGLDTVDAQLAALGASELRAQATAQGAELAQLALREALRSGDGWSLLRWSERWRATALTAPPVRLADRGPLTRDLAALRLVARRLDAAGPDDPATAGLRQERRRLEDSVRRQALRLPGARQGRAARLRAGEVRDLLAGAQLVELANVDGELVAVVLGGRGRPLLHRIGPVAAADRALQHALFALRRQGRGRSLLDIAAIGARLERALLGPVAAELTADAVVFVPPGRLHAVPWGLLPALAGRAVTVAPSTAVWLRCRRAEPPPQGRIVVVGGPRLTGGAQEVRRLAERYPGAEVLAEGAATSERVLSAMDGATLVHVAAHGVFRADSPLLSSLELDDGPLTVYDLQHLRRAPYRVVLSSCNSAVGAPTGVDELLGVVSALVALGAAGVVASVVPVDDPATVPFMLALHRGLAREPLGRALAAARDDVDGDPDVALTARSFIALGA
jgi:tetratricopeptide (TPR) repeat protein